MTVRRWILLAGLILWLILFGLWMRGVWAPEPGKPDVLAYFIAMIALLLVYELSNMGMQYLRKRRARRDGDA
ncbi:hypothetical protein [Pseudoruegeria sp. HB172150]|uniref:hypothetical protein n=1 Tax=Pseudoruegeria sp. HB172150 TaxID=2721164 RepID=UPI0015579464|nr:hypothetical protein [Pseudoruegeria sp. HB172150]